MTRQRVPFVKWQFMRDIIPVDDVDKANLTPRYESPVGRDGGRRRESRIASG